jgi:threonine synthase
MSQTATRNPRLDGLQCVRCGQVFALTLIHTPCPTCLKEQIYVGMRAHYAPAVPGDEATIALPYLQGITLGEGQTPLLDCPKLAQQMGLRRLSLKDESANPTGSHKDRMSAMGVNQALDFGVHTLVLASSGNAAISAARYAQAAGLRCEVATYSGTPQVYARALDAFGAHRHSFDDNSGRWNFVAEQANKPGYLALTNFHLPALGSAPLAVEGYKPIAQECLEQGGLPDHVVVPTARGDLAWGIYAGFQELLQARQIDRLPRIWVVEPFARLSQAQTEQDLGLSFPGQTDQFSVAGATLTYLQWQATRGTQGGAVVVNDSAAYAARPLLGSYAELCAAAALGAILPLRQSEQIAAQDHVVVMRTANASRDPSWSGS